MDFRRLLKRTALFLGEWLAYFAVVAVLAILFMMQPVWVGDRVSADSHSNPRILQRHVEMLSVKLPPREAVPDTLNIVAGYIYDELSQSSGDVSYQEFKVDGDTFRNVIAHFGPNDEQAPLYVIGAHYDSEEGNPGADDNASGVAGLLELARLFSLKPPTVPVELVAYALEEPPYFRTDAMGSFRHAKSLFEQHRTVGLMISLEMLGYYSDAAGSQGYPVPGMDVLYPDSGNFIALVGNLGEPLIMRKFKRAYARSTDLPAYSITAPGFVPGIDFSDHLNFWRFDFPAVMVTDTAFYRNANYHYASDTIDKLDFERMAKAVDGVFGAINGFESASPL